MEEGIEMADNDEMIGYLMSQFLSFSENGKVDTVPATWEKASAETLFDSDQEAQYPYLKEAARAETQKFWNKTGTLASSSPDDFQGVLLSCRDSVLRAPTPEKLMSFLRTLATLHNLDTAISG